MAAKPPLAPVSFRKCVAYGNSSPLCEIKTKRPRRDQCEETPRDTFGPSPVRHLPIISRIAAALRRWAESSKPR